MKKTAVFLTLLLVSVITIAQNNKKDIIYLKGGNVIRGVSTRVDDEKILVHSGRNFLVIKDSQIDSIVPLRSSGDNQILPGDYFFKTTFGILAGSSKNEKKAPFSFDASFILNTGQGLYTGLGIGIDLLENTYLPVFATFEYHFRDTRITPFAGLKGGYMVALDDVISQTVYQDFYSSNPNIPHYDRQNLEDRGGLLISPSFGFTGEIEKNLAFSLAFGYRFHNVNFKNKEDDYTLEKSFNRLSIRLGILFN